MPANDDGGIGTVRQLRPVVLRLQVSVGPASPLLRVLLHPPAGWVQVPANDDGGIGTVRQDATELAAGEVQIQRPRFRPYRFEEQVHLEEPEPSLDELLNGERGKFVEAPAASQGVRQRVEGRIGRLPVDKQGGLATPRPDLSNDRGPGNCGDNRGRGQELPSRNHGSQFVRFAGPEPVEANASGRR